MKKWCLYLAVFLLISFNAFAINSYYSYRMNFPTNEARTHTQTINVSGSVNATIPSGFSFSSCTGGCSATGSNINWSGLSSSAVNYTLTSPSSCTEGTRYTSNIYENDVLAASFVFVCISDLKVVDYKIEYGHGCGNYLDTNVISNESAILFNLIRVWNIGNYLSPNEDAKNVTINCTFENYPVRTYGRVDVSYNPNSINASFKWSLLQGGYWFRIGVLSQDVSGKAVGSTYNVTCNPLTYTFSHSKVEAGFSNYTLDVRSHLPFQINAYQDSSNLAKAIYTIKNNETYNIYDLDINFAASNVTANSHYALLRPNQSISYRTDIMNNTNITIFFTPEWLVNCFSKKVIGQSVIMNVSNLTFIPAPPTPAWGEVSMGGGAYYPLKNITVNISICTPRIVCTKWSRCINGYFERVCDDINYCNITKKERQYRSCEEGMEDILFKEPVLEIPFSELKCGDGICSRGEECICFEDCRIVSLWWFVFSFAILAFIVVYVLRGYAKRGTKETILISLLLFAMLFILYYIYYFGSCYIYIQPMLWLLFLVLIIIIVYLFWPKKKKKAIKRRGYY